MNKLYVGQIICHRDKPQKAEILAIKGGVITIFIKGERKEKRITYNDLKKIYHV